VAYFDPPQFLRFDPRVLLVACTLCTVLAALLLGLFPQRDVVGIDLLTDYTLGGGMFGSSEGTEFYSWASTSVTGGDVRDPLQQMG
jgi:hypothetical protein